MDDYISRADAIVYARHALAKGLNVVEYLEDVPAADVRPVVPGTWKTIGANNRGCGGIFVCSHCDKCYPYKTDFCPNCGVDMRRRVNDS